MTKKLKPPKEIHIEDVEPSKGFVEAKVDEYWLKKGRAEMIKKAKESLVKLVMEG